MTKRSARIWLGVLVAMHAGALCAPWLASDDARTQHREYPLAPPTRVHVVANGEMTRPYVCALRAGARFGEYIEDCSERFTIRLGGDADGFRLFAVDAPGRLFVMGTDAVGRDVWSRLVYAVRVSLLVGEVATAISLLLGVLLGGLAGWCGGLLDRVITRAGDAFLALPWLYLLLAARGVLPLEASATLMWIVMGILIGAIGWVRPGRLVRGILLSARERAYVKAARGFGAPLCYIFRRHLLPSLSGALTTQAAIIVPEYVLAEVALSFFGVGTSDPQPSLGAMLAPLQQVQLVASSWWLVLPAVVTVILFIAFHEVAGAVDARARVAA